MPFHPQIVHFPIALLLLGTLAVIASNWHFLSRLKKWGIPSLVAGWILVLPAVITGLIENGKLESGSRAKMIANQHISAVFVMWGLFGLALFLMFKWKNSKRTSNQIFIISTLILASGVLILASYLGEKLVYEMGAIR